MNLTLPWVMAIAGCCSLAAIAWLRRHPTPLHALDRPTDHKTHTRPVPAVGGTGMLLGVLLVLPLLHWPHAAPFTFALLMLLGLGIIDDGRGLGAPIRFVGQSAAILIMAAFGDVVLRDFGMLLWPGWTLSLGWFAWPVTVFAAVGVLNATNMIDGADGLCGCLALLALLAMAFLCATSGNGALPVLLVAAAALTAFLAFNLRVGGHAARVFLGNGGSLALGGLLAWFLIDLSQGPDRAFAPSTALWLYAIPLIDTVSVMWRRMADGRSPFAADHQHVHHLLLRAGWSVNGTLALLLGAQLLCCAGAILAERSGVDEVWRFAAFMTLAFGLHAHKRRADRRLPPLPRGGLR